MRVPRRKGPAPVDLSALSDATHGYTASASGAGSQGFGGESGGMEMGSEQSMQQRMNHVQPGFLSEEERRRSSGFSVGDGVYAHRSGSTR